MQPTPYQTYTRTKVSSVGNAHKVGLLLKEAAKEMDKVALACDEGRFEERYIFSERACTILAGLRDHMNDSVTGGESLLETLSNYYSVMILACTQINFKNDSDRARQLAQRLRDMAQTWMVLDQNTAAQDIQTTDAAEKIPVVGSLGNITV